MDHTDKQEKEKMAEDVTAEMLPKKYDFHSAGMWEKVKYAKSSVTVEPVLAFFVMPSVLSMLATQNLNLDKACRVNLQFGDDVCTALRFRRRENYTNEEDQVQTLIASVTAWKTVIHKTVPIVLMLFIGAWSDKTGKRKICMLMPIFGEFLTCILNMVNTYFFYEVPVEWTVLMEVIFPALSGGWYTMFLGTFSYIGDITTKDTRTFRIGLLNLCMTVGFPIGMGLSGILLKYIGYYGVFAISALFQVGNFCYVCLSIDDHTWLQNKEKVKRKGISGFLQDFFDTNCLKETFGIVSKKGPNKKKIKMFLILTIVCLTFGPMWGELSVMYIFARYRFNWDEVKFSIFSTYSLLTHSIGTLFSIFVFSKKMQVDDSVLGIISTSSKIFGALIMAFARNNLEAYMSPLVEILNGTSPIAIRSIASKLVSYQELGKLYSLIGVVETIMPLIFAPLYTKVYIATLHVLPGAVFLLSVASTIPALVIFGWFYAQHRKQQTHRTPDIPTEETTTLEPLSTCT